MRASLLTLLLAPLWLAGCSRPRSAREPGLLTTDPPADGCVLVGQASGSAIEQSRTLATARARERLWSEAEAAGGTYVQLATENVTKVEMALDAVQVRLQGRVYRCADADASSAMGAAPATQLDSTLVAADAGDSLTAAQLDGGPFACPAPTVLRRLEASDGPGWQCARAAGPAWIAEGPYVLYWAGGALRAEGSFENGKRSGRWTLYYANGQVRARAIFREGSIEGCSAEFDADGNALAPRCAGDGG